METGLLPKPIARGELVALLVLGAAAFLWSVIRPYSLSTWAEEVAPIIIALPILVATRRRFPLSPLAYRLIFLHALVLLVGGHYTYARVPVGYWVKDLLHLSRNPYDRLGHFVQGFVPAILAREILLRTSPLRRGKWLAVLTTAVCLAISACYEFIEWWAAVLGGASARDFLGTQGDVWDTQWDMFTALIGAIVALAVLSPLHDRQLGLPPKPERPTSSAPDPN